MILQPQIDWSSIAKTWGPLGLMSVLFLLLVWQGAKAAKKAIEDTIADARKERDLGRELLKQQAAEFTVHIKQENEEFRSALKDVVSAFEHAGPRRK